ncbi:MAG: YCF48-related protein [Dehalococcoidia bacterium]|nr:YCF48-related protein [Dehalococcoidia bacterium]
MSSPVPATFGLTVFGLLVVASLLGSEPATGSEAGGQARRPASASQPGNVPAGAPDGHWVWQNPLPTGSMLYRVSFLDAWTGWAAGGTTILKTTDGGDSWTAQKLPGDAPLVSAVAFVDAQTGWAVGGAGGISKTTDGGANWRPQASGTTRGLTGVAFVDAQTGWVAGDGLILHTSDG